MTTIGGMVQDILGTAFTSELWLSAVAVLESRLCVPIKERGRGGGEGLTLWNQAILYGLGFA